MKSVQIELEECIDEMIAQLRKWRKSGVPDDCMCVMFTETHLLDAKNLTRAQMIEKMQAYLNYQSHVEQAAHPRAGMN